MPDDAVNGPKQGRRDVIKKAAVGAGVAWVAPAVLGTTAAHAQGSVPPPEECVGGTLPSTVATANSGTVLGARLAGSLQLCYTSGDVTVGGDAQGANLSIDDFLIIRVTRPDATVASYVVGSYYNNWTYASCPGLNAWVTANAGTATQIPAVPGNGTSGPVEFSALLQADALTPNIIDLFVFNCGGVGANGNLVIF